MSTVIRRFAAPGGAWLDRVWREKPDGYVPIEDRGTHGWDGECRSCGPQYMGSLRTPGGGHRVVCRRCGEAFRLDGTRIER